MSAYFCDPEHAIAIVASHVTRTRNRLAYSEQIETVVSLLRLNAEAVRRRYPNDDEMVPDLAGMTTDEVAALFGITPDRFTPWEFQPLRWMEIIGACDCLAYQCAEFSGWDTTEAAQTLTRIKDTAVRGLPGYGWKSISAPPEGSEGVVRLF